MNGKMIDEVDNRGRRIVGRTLLILFNAQGQRVPFTLPETSPNEVWRLLIDTYNDYPRRVRYLAGNPFPLAARSMTVFELRSSLRRRLARMVRRKRTPCVLKARAQKLGVDGNIRIAGDALRCNVSIVSVTLRSTNLPGRLSERK